MIRPGRHRRSIRLRGYDYAQAGAYFITICSRDRLCLFADIVDNAIDLTPFGEIVTVCWEAIPQHFETAELDAFVIMPNHLHGIVVLDNGSDEYGGVAYQGGVSQGTSSEGTACRAPTRGGSTSRPNPGVGASVERFGAPVAGSIPTIVRSFKAAVTKAVNDDPDRAAACRAFLINHFGPLSPGRIPTLWQSNYHEHIVRSESSLEHLRAYIAANPARWVEDSLHPDNPDAPILGQPRVRPP
jgi:REP element-mobilizing transposase RayT